MDEGRYTDVTVMKGGTLREEANLDLDNGVNAMQCSLSEEPASTISAI